MALVIGNADYELQPLRNPTNDAEDIADVLEKLNFDVSIILNANQEMMELAIREFGEKLHQSSIGLFYYSGHGVQHDGNNYLIPVSSIPQVSTPEHFRYKTVNLGYILETMQQKSSNLSLVLLDACRDNPFRSFSTSKNIFNRLNRGLARVTNTEGVLISYSTAPGEVAFDGDDRNSPYTKHLLKLMIKPNIPIEMMLKEVRARVKDETNGKQIPWYEASIDGNFYFREEKISESLEKDALPLSSPPPQNSLSIYDSVWDVYVRHNDKFILDTYPIHIYKSNGKVKMNRISKETGEVKYSEDIYKDIVISEKTISWHFIDSKSKVSGKTELEIKNENLLIGIAILDNKKITYKLKRIK